MLIPLLQPLLRSFDEFVNKCLVFWFHLCWKFINWVPASVAYTLYELCCFEREQTSQFSSQLITLTGVKYKLLYNIYNRSFLVVLFFLRVSCILPTRKSLEQQEQEQQQQPRTQHQVCTFVCLFVVLFSRKNIQHTSSAQQRIKHLFDHFSCFSMFVLFF